MFRPVSKIDYTVYDANKQLLVCTLWTPRAQCEEKWKPRAAAGFEFLSGGDVLDVVRDLLANPQIRAIVFDGIDSGGRGLFEAFWKGPLPPDLQGIEPAHAEAVQQFVDLYDEDCSMLYPLPPFWPTRLRYVKHP